MTATTTPAPIAPQPSPGAAPRAPIAARTLRKDRWWVEPAITATILVLFVGYVSWAAWENADYYVRPYLSPLYSPCLVSICGHARAGSHIVHPPMVGFIGTWWPVTPALLAVIIPGGIRTTCYYYRKAYYRSIWQAPTACAVAEPHRRYTGETRFPLLLQNVHRLFFVLALLINGVLTWDAFESFRWPGGWGMGIGSIMITVNAALLWGYSLSCHSCRHIVGGRLKHFSRHPVRYWFWGVVSKLNVRHMQIAWVSLIFVALTDLYIRLVAAGWIPETRFF
ncbi:MAG: hypothetical protein ACRDZX_11895 [Acidimicrobiales bacterium]